MGKERQKEQGFGVDPKGDESSEGEEEGRQLLEKPGKLRRELDGGEPVQQGKAGRLLGELAIGGRQDDGEEAKGEEVEPGGQHKSMLELVRVVGTHQVGGGLLQPVVHLQQVSLGEQMQVSSDTKTKQLAFSRHTQCASDLKTI